jgi:signal-transduction protein with cAMP-binding, CBS, and nucleotidyltransferase domain
MTNCNRQIQPHSLSDEAADFEDPLSDYEPRVYECGLHRALAEETIGTLQSQPCIELEPTATVQAAIDALHQAKTASLLLVSEGKVVGIFTERDVLEKVAEWYRDLAETPISEVMTAVPTVVYETDPVALAVEAIAIAGHRHLPVLTIHGNPSGILSPRRVFDFIEKHFAEQE